MLDAEDLHREPLQAHTIQSADHRPARQDDHQSHRRQQERQANVATTVATQPA